MIFFLSLLLTGIIGGLLAGITGVGTGFIMIAVIPIALKHLNIPEELTVQLTIANTIFATMCSSFTNNLQIVIKRTGFLKETLLLALSAGITAAILLQSVVLDGNYTLTIYNSIIVILMAYIILRSVYKLKKKLTLKETITSVKLLITGSFGGGISALTGLGGASIIIPMLNLWMKVNIVKAKTIAYGTIFTSSLILTILNVINEPTVSLPVSNLGYLLLPIALPLAIGVIIGSPFGMKISEKLSHKTISYIFLSVLSIVMIKKIIELLS